MRISNSGSAWLTSSSHPTWIVSIAFLIHPQARVRCLNFKKYKFDTDKINLTLGRVNGQIIMSGGYFLWWPIGGGFALKGYLFQASGIRNGRDFSSWSIYKGGEICRLGLLKGPKGLTDEFYGFIKSRKRSIFVIDSYLKDSAFTAVKRDA